MAVSLLLGENGPWVVPPGGVVPLRFNEGAIVLPVMGGQPTRMGWGRVTGQAAAGPSTPWGLNDATAANGPSLPWNVLSVRYHESLRAPWDENTIGGSTSVEAPWGPATPLWQRWLMPWQRSQGAHRIVRAPWNRAAPSHRLLRAPWQRATPRHADVLAPWQRAVLRPRYLLAPWGRAARLIAPNIPLPEDNEYGQYPGGNVHLHFCVPPPWTTSLVLGRENCITQPRAQRGVILSRPVYMQIHGLFAYRLPELTPVPLVGFSVSSDNDNFGWTLNATGPEEVLSLLAPVAGLPAQIRVTLDGIVFEFLVEGLSRNRSFGQTTTGIRGRSVSALLSDQYRAPRAFLNAVPMTAQQIAEEALTFTDVSLDWQVTDWLVPTGAWSHTGTPLTALRAIADSIGAVLRSPRAGALIAVAPRYPVLPWNWAAATPDVVMALDPVDAEGYERADRPAYEGVYVSGQAQGVLALVKRTGTAPASDKLIPLVTDPLITDLEAARQRGESLLSPSGPMARMTLNLPVLTDVGEPGVLYPGELIEVLDPAGTWRGMVLSVNVTCDRLTARQSVVLERHL